MTFKHTHMIVSTNFELEPVIDEYKQNYPNATFTDCQVVFKTENERPDTPYTYIVVFDYVPPQGRVNGLWEYIAAWCVIHSNTRAVASVTGNVFPELYPTYQHSYHVAGPEKPK